MGDFVGRTDIGLRVGPVGSTDGAPVGLFVGAIVGVDGDCVEGLLVGLNVGNDGPSVTGFRVGSNVGWK